MIWVTPSSDLIKTPKEAINVFDFEPVAHENVPPAHFGYMASGLDDEVTLRANREGFLKFKLRPRRLNDVSKVDMSIEIFGGKYDSPIFLCPTGGNQFFHPEGEVAVAKAARGGNHLQILSNSSNYSVEEVSKGARRADLVPALCLAALRGSASADHCRRRFPPRHRRGEGAGDGRAHVLCPEPSWSRKLSASSISARRCSIWSRSFGPGSCCRRSSSFCFCASSVAGVLVSSGAASVNTRVPISAHAAGAQRRSVG
jgi:hypothetical protein